MKNKLSSPERGEGGGGGGKEVLNKGFKLHTILTEKVPLSYTFHLQNGALLSLKREIILLWNV